MFRRRQTSLPALNRPAARNHARTFSQARVSPSDRRGFRVTLQPPSRVIQGNTTVDRLLSCEHHGRLNLTWNALSQGEQNRLTATQDNDHMSMHTFLIKAMGLTNGILTTNFLLSKTPDAAYEKYVNGVGICTYASALNRGHVAIAELLYNKASPQSREKFLAPGICDFALSSGMKEVNAYLFNMFPEKRKSFILYDDYLAFRASLDSSSIESMQLILDTAKEVTKDRPFWEDDFGVLRFNMVESTFTHDHEDLKNALQCNFFNAFDFVWNNATLSQRAEILLRDNSKIYRELNTEGFAEEANYLLQKASLPVQRRMQLDNNEVISTFRPKV